MIRLFLLSLQVRFHITANRILHLLRRIPGLKKLISPEVYGNYTLKKVFVVIGAIFIINKRILLHLMYIILLITFGMFFHKIEINGGFYELFSGEGTLFKGVTIYGMTRYMLFTWFILSVVGGITSTIIAGENHKNDDIMINYFRSNPTIYSHGRILFARIVDLLLYIPFLLITFSIIDIPLWGIIPTLILYTALRLSGEAINLIMFRRIGKHFGNTAISIVTMLVYGTTVLLIPVNMDMPEISVFFCNPIITAISIPIGIVSWMYIKKYQFYLPLLRDKIKWYNDAMTEAQMKDTHLNFRDAKKWSESITQADLQSDKHVNKTGFAYLNAIFFDRHHKYFKRKLLFRNLAFLALPVAAVLFLIYSLIIGESPASLFNDIELRSLFFIAPIFFFIIYMVTMGRVVTASVFSNCDIHMLHYPYYRIRETIFASFKARFIVILRYNFIITTVMFFSVISAIWLIFGYMDFLYAGVFFVLLTLIGTFFAFNDLFLYYVIQPYDSAGKGKSTVYTIINFVIYFIAYLNISNFRTDLIIYSTIIAIATVLYTGIGLLLLRLFAPKNFRLR